jgi:ATP-dependent DNA ligase
MLAQEAAGPFDDPAFLFEIKWDGYRALLERDAHGHVHLWGRSGRDLGGDLPGLRSGLDDEVRRPCLLDGEVIALHEGRSDFARLRSRREPVVYVAFDLLRWEGDELLALSLLERRARLAAVPAGPRLLHSQGVVGTGLAYFRAVCAQSLEGVMAKDLRAPYRPGARTSTWLKVLNALEERFAVIAAEGRAPGRIDALWLADGEGRPVGRVSGVPAVDAATVLAHLDRGAPASAGAPLRPLVPGLFCRVRHRGRPEGGALRHPVYAGVEAGLP